MFQKMLHEQILSENKSVQHMDRETSTNMFNQQHLVL